jgi:uncharacterized protein
MTPGLFALLAAAGVAAGLVGSIAGLASLFSYPALLAAGLPATSANVTNIVSLAVASVSTVTSSRPELVGQSTSVRRLGPTCALGGAAGAGLLLVTPPGLFERIVPFLVAIASVSMLIGKRMPADQTAPAGTGESAVLAGAAGRRPLLTAGVLAVAVYGGYFGAAAGVLMLALLLTALPESLIRVNALKNLLIGLSNMIAALGFAIFGPVRWMVALPLTAGLLVGSWVGPWAARRLPAGPLRIGIAVAGLGLAIELGWNTF